MPSRTRFIPRTTQPQEIVGLNRQHPLAEHVVGLFVPSGNGSLINLLDNSESTGNALPAIGANGVASSFNYRDARFTHKPEYAITGSGVTFLICLEVDSYADYTHIISKQGSNSALNTPYEFRLGTTASAADYCIIRCNSTFRGYGGGSGGATAPTNTPFIAGFSIADSNADTAPVFVQDGKVWTSGYLYGTATGAVTDDGSSQLMFGYRPDAATKFYGRIFGAVLLKTGVSEEQLSTLSQNIWDFYETQQIFSPVVVASGVTTASITSASGVSTTSGLTGASTASSGVSQADGVSTAATLTGSAISTASFTQADGVSTAGTLTGSSTFSGTLGQADGVSTVSAQTGASTASTTVSAAAGVSTTGTLSSDGATTASFGTAAGVSTTSILAGSSVAAAAISPAAGVSTTANLETNGVATQTRGGMSTNQKKRRKRLLKAPEIPETVKALILDLTAAKPIPEARVTKAVTEIALLQADPSLERLKSDLKSLLEQVKKLPITPEVITDSQEPEEPSETLAVAELTQKVETLQKDVSNLHKKLDNVLKAITKLEDVLIAINS